MSVYPIAAKIDFVSLPPKDKKHPLGSINRNNSSSTSSKDGVLGVFSNLSSIADQAMEVINTGKNIGSKLVQIMVGQAGMVLGGIGAYLFKDNSMADTGCKILAVAGLISTAFGVFGLTKVNKEPIKVPQPDPARQKVDQATSESCKKTEKDLLAKDKNFSGKYSDSESKIYSNQSDADLRTSAISYLDSISASGVTTVINSMDEKSELRRNRIITNVSESEVNLIALRDRIASCLGYISGSRPAAGADPNNNAEAVLDKFLKSDDASNPYIVNQGIRELLPDDFEDAVKLARWYRDIHLGKGDSVKALIGDQNAWVEKLKSAKTIEQKDEAIGYLTKLQNTENYLNVLYKTVQYVLETEDLSDEKVSRNVSVLRQALIVGFDLKGINSLEEANKEIKKVFDDTNTEKGLKSKRKELSDYFASSSVVSVIDNAEFPFQRIETSVSDNEVLDGLDLHEFVEKKSSD